MKIPTLSFVRGKKSIIKNIDILTTERQHVVVSKKMGVYLHECFLEWKKRKKNKNK